MTTYGYMTVMSVASDPRDDGLDEGQHLLLAGKKDEKMFPRFVEEDGITAGKFVRETTMMLPQRMTAEDAKDWLIENRAEELSDYFGDEWFENVQEAAADA